MRGPKTMCALVAAVAIALLALRVEAGTQGKNTQKWRALHLINYLTDEHLERLSEQIPRLAEMGINTLILEINYGFKFETHPELRAGTAQITGEAARRFAELCRNNRIRLIPQFQSVGHQSWGPEVSPLLKVYPQYDLTPGAFPANEGIYCREWDPLNPDVNRIVFRLMDEILDAFQANAMHVGMDEVFLLGSDQSPSTRGQDPATLFAKAVNDIYGHLVQKRRVEMLMWGDRLFDADKYGWDGWEASKTGTAPAIDMIPKDIIISPWHYEPMESYPSIPLFLEKGFRVLPASSRKLEATRSLIEYSFKHDSPRMLGHLFTTWGEDHWNIVEYAPLAKGMELVNQYFPDERHLLPRSGPD